MARGRKSGSAPASTATAPAPVEGPRAAGNVVLEGEPGTVVPQGTELQRDDGATYLTQVAATIGESGEATVRVVAAAAGEEQEAGAGEVFELAPPIDGCTAAMVGVDGLVLPADLGPPPEGAPTDPAAIGGTVTVVEPTAETAPVVPQVLLSVLLNGHGTPLVVPADIVASVRTKGGQELLDVRAQLPDGRVLALERVPVRAANEERCLPFCDRLIAPTPS